MKTTLIAYTSEAVLLGLVGPGSTPSHTQSLYTNTSSVYNITRPEKRFYEDTKGTAGTFGILIPEFRNAGGQRPHPFTARRTPPP